MKDHLIAILETLRLARAELKTHDARRVNGPRTIQRLKHILFDDICTQALAALGQIDESPSLVPSHDDQALLNK